ncbi:hypothetical protein UlMin_040816 [Ulmus minor]
MVDKLTDAKLNVVYGAIEVIQHYYNTFIHKNPCMNSSQMENKWLREVLNGNNDRSNYGLQGSRRTNVIEIIGMFLHILRHGVGNKLAQECFQHSVLNAICLMSVDVLKPQVPKFKNILIQILNDSRYMPHFKYCIDAIDGVHVQARITPQNQVPFIGRKGTPTQNIMVVCNFDMQFIYALVGWEDNAHDAQIFLSALRDQGANFPKPPELFNHAHSSLRRVIKCTFRVWKKQLKILRDMPSYSFEKQVKIVVATMTLPNYIRRHIEHDRHFAKITDNYGRAEDNGDLEPHITSVTRSLEMDALRDVIAGSLMGM